jgi:uncharacterized membrane protein
MKRDAGASYALSTFFVLAGVLLAAVVAAFTIRGMIAPTTQTWTAWTTGALTLVSVLAVALWITGGVLASRVHRARRDRVSTFLTREERQQVLDAVARFEKTTSGEMRVHLAEHSQGDPTRAAVHAFEKLGMTRTRDRNGVMFFVSVRDHRVAVIGDAGIHERVPPDFWAGIVRAMELAFAQGRFADGLVEGISMVGACLVEHCPPRAGDVNELPDSLSDDRP